MKKMTETSMRLSNAGWYNVVCHGSSKHGYHNSCHWTLKSAEKTYQTHRSHKMQGETYWVYLFQDGELLKRSTISLKYC